MADIKKLLNKKGWTGRELGIIELTNMSEMYRQALEGVAEPTPLVEAGQFQKMINGIVDRSQGIVYNGYISIEFEGIENCIDGIEIGFDNLKKYLEII